MIAEQIFRKPFQDISLEDVREYFKEEREETPVLEFKSGGTNAKDIIREMNAFLNTEGGLLIVGAPKELRVPDGVERKICTGDLDLCKTIKDKASLLQQIVTSIVPFPNGIRISELTTANGTVFLIEVSQSMLRPHQLAGEGRYYIRVGTSAMPAPHSVLKTLFHSSRVPHLILDIDVQSSGKVDSLSIQLANHSSMPAEKAGILLEVFGVDSVRLDSTVFTKATADNRFGTVHSALVAENVIEPRAIRTYRYNVAIHRSEQPYLMKISYWAVNLEIEKCFCLYSPKDSSLRRFDLNEESDILELQALITKPESHISFIQ
jgi:hypothetical protein